MKSIKKFSAEINQPKSILESIDSKALTELINGMGFKNIHELKKEKALLTKLEALLKEVAPISEDDATEIEDKLLKKAKPKSLESKTGKKEPKPAIGSNNEVAEGEDVESEEVDSEEDVDDMSVGELKDLVKDIVDQKLDQTEEETEAGEKTEAEEELEEESEVTPKATRKIMTFEDFIQEKTESNEAEAVEQEELEEEELEEKELEEEELEETFTSNYSNGSVKESKSNMKTISKADWKKSAKGYKTEINGQKYMIEYDDERDATILVPVIVEDVSLVNVSGMGAVEFIVKSFSQFVAESYILEKSDDGPALQDEEIDYEGSIVLPIAKGDGPKSASDIEDTNVNMGKPKKLKNTDGETFVTDDQEIKQTPETAEDEVEVHGKVIVKESDQVTESHFKVGDTVKMSHGGTGVVVSLDKEDGEDDEAYYNIKLPNGDMMKHAPNELTKVMEESEVNEAEIKSNDEFKEYAEAVLKKAFGDEYDEAKAQEVVDGLTSKYSGDYGAMIGALTSSLGEAVEPAESK